MIEYKDDSYLACFEDWKQIIDEHYEELSVTKEYPLDPDFDAYKALWDMGRLKFISCKDNGKLVGYIIFFVAPHIHYKSCLTAQEDIYYLKKEYRKGRVGIRMFQFAEKVLKDQAVNRVIYNTKIHQDNSSLFEYLGYKLIDKVFTKML